MTDEQINAAIAEACGWAHANIEPHAYPNYCIDLNAMHEAEKVLTREQINAFCQKLFPTNYCGVWWSIHATARQRAEAFLKTLGKWEEATDKDCLTVQAATTEESSVIQKEVQK